ncbi:MAG: hypothetical protein GY792_22540, partial [Gammaproteobacteria bacterium]|nr:hypothetical protein [Gammaproteobacteria bacterium]
AMNAILRECADDISIVLEGSLSAICRQAGINRTQLYERKTQLWKVLAEVELAGPGRPVQPESVPMNGEIPAGYDVREQLLRYRLDHPGAMILHAGGSTSYSDSFKRFVLDLLDTWEGNLESFCQWAEIPYQTLTHWRKRDGNQPYIPQPIRTLPELSRSATEECRSIVEDYTHWEGSLRDFLSYEAKRLRLPPNAIRRVLTITGMLSSKPKKPHATVAAPSGKPLGLSW